MGQHEVEYNQKSVKTSSQPLLSVDIFKFILQFPIYKVIFHSDVYTHTHTWIMGIYGRDNNKIFYRTHYFLLDRLERILLDKFTG